mmetsp:Transcript_20535/g.37045  ORF Transcript_20535/g.37045 Transcript_20535/m.37045 type:complete len:423 (+) Transcript_20535:145-1413(+)
MEETHPLPSNKKNKRMMDAPSFHSAMMMAPKKNIVDETHPPPSNKKNKKGKNRKRSPKKSSSDCDGRSTSPPNSISKSDGHQHHADRKPPIKTTNAAKNNASNLKVRSGDYPYPTDYNDHFETPARAYDDIFPLLEYILAKKQNPNSKQKSKHAKSKQDNKDEKVIYDPYYCTGRAATLLDGVFQRHKSNTISAKIRIQHEKRDFYHDIEEKTVPKYDILITNPPYSGNHKEQCLEFAVNQLTNHGRPFFLLMPNYIAMKEYFRKIVLDGGSKKMDTFYIAPSSNHPYEYEHPEGTGHNTSPFASVWFCGLTYTDGKSNVTSVTDAFLKFHSSHSSPTGAPRIATGLQELIRIGGVSGEKRKNPRQRKKMRQEAMERANNAAGGGVGGGTTGSSDGGKATNDKRKSGSHGGQNSSKKKRKFK